MKSLFSFPGLATVAVALLALDQSDLQAQQYWRTDGASGSWTNTNWGSSAAGPFTTAYTPNADAIFTASSTVTFATVAIGNVMVADGITVTNFAGGTATFGTTGTGGLVRTFDIGTGATFIWQSQTITANSSAGLTKNGKGTLDLGSLTWSTTMNGGFTLNAGTLIVAGNKSQGNGVLNLNGGTLQTSGTRDYTPTSIVVGGDFALAGTGNQNWDAATTIALGSSTRTITNNTTSGSRQFRGLVSGNSGAGLTFSGAGGAQIYLGNTGNTFNGPLAINGAEVVFNDDGTFGSTASITLDGGRLTMATMDTGGNTSALTSATINSSRNIFVGATAGTAISIQGGTGVTTYNGVIADKPSATGILVKQGGGLLALGGANTFSGSVSINNGVLQVTNGSNRLPTNAVVNLGQAASANLGTLDLNGNDQTIAGLNSTSGNNTSFTGKNTITNSGAAISTLTISGSGSNAYGDGSTNNSGVIRGAINLVMNGSGTQTLGDTNTYSGNTVILKGTLAVGAKGVINNSPVIEVAGGATLDVSAVTAGLVLNSSETLNASGTSSAGTIATGSNPGLAFGATGKLLFSAFNGTIAPLAISGSGAITLAGGNVVIVTNVSGAPFAVADYKLISTNGAGGYVSGAVPTSVAVYGNGIVGGGAPSLIISNSELYLHVVAGVANPATNNISFSGITASIGVSGAPNTQYALETTTNLLKAWLPIQTNSTDVNGSHTFTDLDATNRQQFYRTRRLP